LISDAVLISKLDALCIETQGRKWSWVAGFEALYAISTDGKLVSMPREVSVANGFVRKKKMKLRLPSKVLRDGKLQSLFSKLSHSDVVGIRYATYPSMILEAFVGPKPSEEHVAHVKNADPLDLRLENLEWSTHREIRLATVHGAEVAKGHRFAEGKYVRTRSVVDDNLYLRITRAAKAGVSIQLSANECAELARSEAFMAATDAEARSAGVKITNEGLIRLERYQ